MMKTKLIRLCVLAAFGFTAACSANPAALPLTPAGTAAPAADAATRPPTATPSALPPTASPIPPSPTPDASVQAAAKATIQASKFAEVVNQLKTDGVITESQGVYHRLADIDQAAALRGEYFWIPTDFSPTNFVLQADVSWQSADANADWSVSGPGFLFHETGDKRFYALFLRLNGQADLYRIDVNSDTFFYVANKKIWNEAKPDGKASFMLVVENDAVNLYVDGQPVFDAKDANLTAPAYGSGRLNFAIASGTNKDFGTRVIFSNIELWELGSPEHLAQASVVGTTNPAAPSPATTRSPNNALTEQGVQAYQSADFEKSVTLLSQAITADPNYSNPDGYITRGRAYYALKQYAKAIADYTQAVRFAPAGEKIYLYRGYAYEKMKNYAKALSDYDTAIKLDAGDVWAYRSRAMVYAAQKKYPEALQDLDQAILLAGDSAPTYNNRCWLKYLQKEYAEALPDCDKALALEPDDPNYLESRAFVYKALEQPEKARADFERVLTLTEDKTTITRIQGELKKLPAP